MRVGNTAGDGINGCMRVRSVTAPRRSVHLLEAPPRKNWKWLITRDTGSRSRVRQLLAASQSLSNGLWYMASRPRSPTNRGTPQRGNT